MDDETNEETVYIKIGVLGTADEAVGIFTFSWDPTMKVSELEHIVNTEISRTAGEAGREFGIILGKHITDTLERRNRDDPEF